MPVTVINQSIRRRITAALFASQSLFSAATIASFTVTSIIAADLSGNDSAAGLPATVSLVARAAAAYPIGWLLDRVGRRLGLSIGYFVGLAGSVIGAWSVVSGSFAGFLTGAALIGGSRASSQQSRYVAAEIYPARSQSKAIGWIVFAGTVGAIGGPALVSLSEKLAVRLAIDLLAGPFVLSAMLMLVAAIVVFVFLRPDPARIGLQVARAEAASLDGPREVARKARPLREIFSGAPALLAVASMAIGQLVMALLMVITPLHMNHNDHSTQAISLVIMAHTLGMFGLSGITGWLIERTGRRAVIAGGSSMLVVACLLAPVSTAVPLLALSLFLLGLGWNFCFVAGSSMLSTHLASSERGRAQGAGEVAVALGAGAGSLGSGIIFARGDVVAVSVVGLGFSLTLLAMVIWMQVSRRPARAFVLGE